MRLSVVISKYDAVHVAGIIERVRTCENPPFRPSIPDAMCEKKWKVLMSSCWEEQPHMRKNFSHIRGRVAKFGKLDFLES